jgi:D-alanyl-D-alanine carboxypeptidase/D-alanyl-D-alanine-endopeptidase (penicillin-binding protein 4)
MAKTRAVITVACIACAASTAAVASGPAGLDSKLAKALTAPSLSLGRTAALAVDVSTGTIVFAHNESLPVAPASNEKIPVSWAALSRLGVGYRFHTEVYGVGSRAGATWVGDLVLKGFGDPTLSAADLERLAVTIRGRGIRSVSGRVLGDESFYDTKRGAAGWKRSFVGGESPPLSALIVDRAQGWPALSPPLLAARALRDALVRQGVLVGGRPGLGVAPAMSVSLASDTSDPLAQIVRRMNHESDNFYAEMLLKQLVAATGAVGTSAGGGKLVVATMRDAGIPTGGVRLLDGSGLSSLDRLTAAALVGVIRAGVNDPTVRAAFVDSLAVAGMSGTLSSRLPALRGKVKGKTGTTDLACTLSGLIRGTVAFAVLENGSPISSWTARAAQDRFVTILASTPVG